MGPPRVIDLGDGGELRVLEGDSYTDPASGNSLTGAWVWDASIVLSMWFTTKLWPPGSFIGKRVVELGAGTSVPGMTLAKLGAHVVLTDRKPLLAGMEANILENKLGANARVCELQWGLNPGQIRGIQLAFWDMERGDLRISAAVSVGGSGADSRILEAASGGKTGDLKISDAVSSLEIADRETLQPAGGSNSEAVQLGGDGCENVEKTLNACGGGEGSWSSEANRTAIDGEPHCLDAKELGDSSKTVPSAIDGDVQEGGVASSSGKASEPAIFGGSSNGTSQTTTEGPKSRRSEVQEGPKSQGDDEDDLGVDFVIGSDIMFDPDSETMRDLSLAIKSLSGRKTRVFLCCELRPPLPECFRHLHDQGLTWKAVPQEDLHPDWCSEDIKIFEVLV